MSTKEPITLNQLKEKAKTEVFSLFNGQDKSEDFALDDLLDDIIKIINDIDPPTIRLLCTQCGKPVSIKFPLDAKVKAGTKIICPLCEKENNKTVKIIKNHISGLSKLADIATKLET